MSKPFNIHDWQAKQKQQRLDEQYYVTVNRGPKMGKSLVTSAESDYEEPRVFSNYGEAEKYIKRVKSSGATPGQIASYWVSDENMNKIEDPVVAKGDGLEITQDEMERLHRNGRVRLKDGSLLVFPSKPLNVKEAIVDYDFSKEELIRVIKQLKRGASTEIEMIKAFEKALGRELTDDEIRGFKLKEENIDEHHGDDFPKDLLDKTFNSFLNKLKKKNETDYNKVEDIVKKHFSVDEASMIGTGASFQAGAGEAYATPYAFKKKNKRKKD